MVSPPCHLRKIKLEVAQTADVRPGSEGDDAPDELNDLSLSQIFLPGYANTKGLLVVAPIHECVNKAVRDNAVVEEEHVTLHVPQ